MLWRMITAATLFMGSTHACCEEKPKSEKEELWNASEYAKNSKVQETHFERFFDYNSLFGCKKVLDIGCGDGRFTAKLAEFLKNGKVIGIDSSQGMIEHALSQFTAAKYPNLEFERQTAQTFHFDEKFDYVVSIHTLHWIKEQEETLKNIYDHLNAGGKVFFLFAPSKEGLPFDLALRETTKKWSGELGSFKTNQYFFDMESYRKMLIETGYHVDGIHYVFTETLHDGKKALGDWVKQWLPHYKALPDTSKEPFLTDLVESYIEHSTAHRKDAPILWGEYVMIVKASKR
ncbi:MAG: methyltransferase domain-containing protein [Verrucomicrobia bacterium]|nr:methyltransferase domain-containing protein [Verrucomicrobiota bacterium]